MAVLITSLLLKVLLWLILAFAFVLSIVVFLPALFCSAVVNFNTDH